MNNSLGGDIDASQVHVVGIPNRYVPGGGGFGGNRSGEPSYRKNSEFRLP
jgi:hypothetical protein